MITTTPRKNDSHPPSLQKLLNVSFENLVSSPGTGPRPRRPARASVAAADRSDPSRDSIAQQSQPLAHAGSLLRLSRAPSAETSREILNLPTTDGLYFAPSNLTCLPPARSSRVSLPTSRLRIAARSSCLLYRPLPPRAQSQMLSSPQRLDVFLRRLSGFLLRRRRQARARRIAPRLFATRAAFFVVSSESTAVFVAPLACASAAPATILGHARSSACPCRLRIQSRNSGEQKRRVGSPRRDERGSRRHASSTQRVHELTHASLRLPLRSRAYGRFRGESFA